MRNWKSFAEDEGGEVSPLSFLLLVVIVAIGGMVGVASFRDSLVQEFGDVALALENLDQSYSFSVGTTTSQFEDTTPGNGPNPVGFSPATAEGEDSVAAGPGG